MKKLLLTSLLALSFACAGTDQFSETGLDDSGSDMNLGETEQELMAAPMGASQFGFKPTSEVPCVQNASTQTCIVPRVKALRYYITGGNAAQHLDVKFWVTSWYNGMVGLGLDQSANGWLFSEATGVNDPDLTLLIALEPGTGGACAGDKAKTVALSCFTGSRVALNEVPSGIYGNYERWAATPVLHIDYTEIANNLSWTPSQRQNATRHAVWSGLLRFVGSGLVIVGDTRCSKADTILNNGCFLRQQQVCAANSFGDTGNQSDWWFGGTDCGQ